MSALTRHEFGGKKIGEMGEIEAGTSKALGGGRAGHGLEESGGKLCTLFPVGLTRVLSVQSLM